jgi:opacity protein-like surface antigen
MRSLKLALLATAATAVLSSAAFAADLVVDTPPMAPVVDNSFSWDGAYIGAFIQGQTAPAAFGIGANLGVNALMDNLVLGGEIEGTAGTGGTFSGQLTGHVGGLLADSTMIYAFTGIGTRTFTGYYVPLGAGVEFRVTDNLGIKAEAQYNWDLGVGPNSAVAKVGFNWHF